VPQDAPISLIRRSWGYGFRAPPSSGEHGDVRCPEPHHHQHQSTTTNCAFRLGTYQLRAALLPGETQARDRPGRDRLSGEGLTKPGRARDRVLTATGVAGGPGTGQGRAKGSLHAACLGSTVQLPRRPLAAAEGSWAFLPVFQSSFCQGQLAFGLGRGLCVGVGGWGWGVGGGDKVGKGVGWGRPRVALVLCPRDANMLYQLRLHMRAYTTTFILIVHRRSAT
jgi:hypothetical protein